jgi:DNA-nicking Smr family endonuclease
MERADFEPESVAVPITSELDLHSFAPADTASVVEEYVTAAAQAGFRTVRLIHGRGTGVQRAIVHRTLARLAEVGRFWDDPAAHLGATFAELVVKAL